MSRTLGSLSDVCGLGRADVLARKRPEIELRRLWPSSEGVWLRIVVFVCPWGADRSTWILENKDGYYGNGIKRGVKE